MAISLASLSGILTAQLPALAATYLIHDVGSPGPAYFNLSQVTGFNNTGQFVGNAELTADAGDPYLQCIAFTGKAWVPLQGKAETVNCYASSGISDADAAGVFTTVGYGNIPTSNPNIAFYSTVSPTSATTHFFVTNQPSQLYLENKSGLAAGWTYYNPVLSNFASTSPPVTSTGTSLSLLQPYCTTSVSTCAYQPSYVGVGYSLGGRFINAGGTVFAQAINNTNGSWVESTGGKSPTSLQFTLPPDGSNAAQGIAGIDDSGDVTYFEYDTKLAENRTWVYNPNTKVAKELGTLKGSSCTSWTPLWINGPGRVLGTAQNCSVASDSTYWTWDSSHGIVRVSYNGATYSSIYARTINDLGEISVDLFYYITGTSTLAHHWGYLKSQSPF